ncbi:hypothetical protein Aperf_G00000090930 [Anoplocephala perfoliata]
MVGVGVNKIDALGRVSIVDYNGNVLYDVFSRPDGCITDYRTRYSGIRPRDMEKALPFKVVRNDVQQIIRDRVVVGHSINNDFRVLKLYHPPALVRDTSVAPYAKVAVGRGRKRLVALRELYFDFFDEEIQQGEHDSVEDARATMKIYRRVEKQWEADLIKKLANKNNENVRKKYEQVSKGLYLLENGKFPEGPIGLDCEIAGVDSYKQTILRRVSIVDNHGNVLYDVYCRSDKRITDPRTRYSVSRLRDALPFKVVQSEVEQMIKDRIVVGHSIRKDFEALRLSHPPHLIRDTCIAPYAKQRVGRSKEKPVPLRDLYFDFFHEDIQQDEVTSVEDARATMKIYREVEREWEADLRKQFARKLSVVNIFLICAFLLLLYILVAKFMGQIGLLNNDR